MEVVRDGGGGGWTGWRMEGVEDGGVKRLRIGGVHLDHLLLLHHSLPSLQQSLPLSFFPVRLFEYQDTTP